MPAWPALPHTHTPTASPPWLVGVASEASPRLSPWLGLLEASCPPGSWSSACTSHTSSTRWVPRLTRRRMTCLSSRTLPGQA